MADTFIKSEYFLLEDDTPVKFIPPQAEETVYGGIKAASKTDEDTQEVKIDPTTGKLYVKPTLSSEQSIDLTQVKQNIKNLQDKKLNANHGADNSGKLLAVDTQGDTEYVDKPKAVYDETLNCVKIV